MKTLFLLRHAKSSWRHPQPQDHDRPLNLRGQSAAPLVGRLMQGHSLFPEQVLCSTSLRTRQTWELVSQEWPSTVPVEFRGELYHATADGLQTVIRTVAPVVNSVMIIGHNPGLADFLETTVGFTEKYPTAALAHLTVEIAHWSEFSVRKSLRLLNLWRPRDFSAPAA